MSSASYINCPQCDGSGYLCMNCGNSDKHCTCENGAQEVPCSACDASGEASLVRYSADKRITTVGGITVVHEYKPRESFMLGPKKDAE